MRTACQVISQLDLASISPNPLGLSPLVIQERHDQAFDVEPVTQEFFRKYHSTFTHVEELIRGIRDKESKRLFTQRLFNRLMFIAFIQKKGWLQFGGSKNNDYFNALWLDYRKNGNTGIGFYYERLYNLFFHGLAAQDDADRIKQNRGGLFRELLGNVPYLNGGLFEEEPDDKDESIRVPDEAIQLILHDLFDRFNFTVTESTPLDLEVAVDPEMLGKVFEELVTGRHETGSYYTPKPIVSFMCREALKGYLGANLPKEKPEQIARFVDEHDAGGLRDGEAALEALRGVKVCDPACGSGAYLLGMLHELVDLRTYLFSVKKIDSISAYDRKLEIIQRSIYGVDLDPFAVSIARLRLWLSLAVEFEGEQPEPLPNLRFEIEEGDSLLAPGPEPSQGLMREEVVKRFTEAKALYIKAHSERKKLLEREVIQLKESIASWTHGKNAVRGFDWPVEFAEVFREGGFDIAIANPPYVRQELIKEIKPTLKDLFPQVYSGIADLYVYFYARAVQIIKPNGMIAFISSNKWLRANYGEKLKNHLALNCNLFSITDFGGLPVFRSAITYPMIFVAQKGAVKQPTTMTKVPDLLPPYPDVKQVVRSHGQILPPGAISGSKWSLGRTDQTDLLKLMELRGTPLSEYVQRRVFRGLLTGFNAAFFIDSETRAKLIRKDPNSKELIKPLAQGRNIRKWNVAAEDKYIIVTRLGVRIKDYPAIFAHLKQWQSELERRYDQGDHWWELRRCDYYDVFDQPKIVYQEIATYQAFAFDQSGLYVNNKVFMIPTSDLFLLAVLNSSSAWVYLDHICSKLQGGAFAMQTPYLFKLPIPHATAATKEKIEKLAKTCIGNSNRDCKRGEAQMNSEVAALYGIDPNDVEAFSTKVYELTARGRKTLASPL